MGRWRHMGIVGLVATTLLTSGGCGRPADASQHASAASLAPLLPVTTAADVRASDAALSADLDTELASGRYERVRSLIVLSHGRTVYERYFHSAPTDRHDVYSVSDSLIGLLVGIAIEDGLIDGVDQTLAALLPDRAATMAPSLARATLLQVLTDRAGLADELPAHSRTSTGDELDALLANPVATPGHFLYSANTARLLTAILAHATGRSVLDYARDRLLTPLGIASTPFEQPAPWDARVIDGSRFSWTADPPGGGFGSTGLRLTAHDLAKIGLLVLQDGRWEGRQVVPAQWMRAATAPQVGTGTYQDGYGYQWWNMRTGGGEHVVFAAGAGMQAVLVVPADRLVVAYQVWLPESGDSLAGGLMRELVASTVLPALAA